MQFVDPKTDIAFKKIFSNEAHKEILQEFLKRNFDFGIADCQLGNFESISSAKTVRFESHQS